MTFKKGQSGNPNGRPEGARGKATLAREERRAIFDEEVAKMYLETIRKAKPEYLLDQFLGKAPDKLDVTTDGEKISTPIPPEALAIIEEQLKKNKTNGQ